MIDRVPSGRDDDLWRVVTSEITPLRGRKLKAKRTTENSLPTKIGKPEPPTIMRVDERVLKSDDTHKSPGGTVIYEPLSFDSSPGADKRTVQRLKRGKLPIEAQIDLHGFTLVEARNALTSFLNRVQNAKFRVVLVITGKGQGGRGVLREAVPLWLNDVSIRPLILAFSRAQPADGGTGALYILLRKNR